MNRRALIKGGAAAAGGFAGLAVASKLAAKHGLVPPDGCCGVYGPGHTLTYAVQRLLTRSSLAREFRPDQVSAKPFANPTDFRSDDFERLRRSGFADWSLTIDGLVDRPASFSLAELRTWPSRSQITLLACEEGWSYVAQWTGVPLSALLDRVGVRPEARFVNYSSMQPGWFDAIDMADARHPQTVLAYGFNGADLPPDFGGPLRMRVPRQLGYKSVKFVNRLTLAAAPTVVPSDYSWYAGI
ncbi:MAG: molybdopterin-dependent oxidoreductase [Vicinamibacteria bacterium]